MSYQSPLHILDYFGDASSDLESLDLNKLRKQFLAEFNLTNEIEISVHDKKYTKDAIIKLIDELKSNEHLKVHQVIYANKKVLAFFEKPTTFPPIQEIIALYNHTEDEPVKAHLQTLLYDALTVYYKWALNKKQYVDCKHAFVLVKQLSEFDQINFYDFINKTIDHIIELLESILYNEGESSYEEIESKLEFIYKNSLSVFLNALPEEFSESIRTLVNTIVNCLAEFHNRKTASKDFIYKLSSELKKIHCKDAELKKIVDDNHNIFSGSGSGSGSSDGSTYGVVKIIFALIWVCVMIARIGSCKSERNKYDFHSDLQNYFRTETKHQYSTYKTFVYSMENSEVFSKLGDTSAHVFETYQNPLGSLFEGNHDNVSFFDTNTCHIINSTSYDMILFKQGKEKGSRIPFWINKKDTLKFSFDSLITFNLYIGKNWLGKDDNSNVSVEKLRSFMFFSGLFTQPLKGYRYYMEHEIILETQKPENDAGNSQGKKQKKKKKQKKTLPGYEFKITELTSDSLEFKTRNLNYEFY